MSRRVVAVGGGHGLAASLRALRSIADVTAVVSVADDGGSSGRLRRTSDQAAPGDLRKCLVALAEPDSALARALEFRFDEGELDGHALGNLLLMALSETSGGLMEALDELGRLLALEGRVLPATVDPVDLVGFTEDGREVRGQVAVAGTRDIVRVALDPTDAEVAPGVLEAVASAELIVLGPGSLYTSVLAATAVPLLAEAIQSSAAHVVYVCNLRPQEGETHEYTVADHVAALDRHGLWPDTVLYDPDTIGGADGVVGAVAARLTGDDSRVHDAELLRAALRSIGTTGRIDSTM